MINKFIHDKSIRVFLILSGIFVSNVIIAELLGVKIFSLERSLGFEPIHMKFFGQADLSFSLTVGVLIWPIVFIMTDIINEYYGRKGVRFLSYLTAGIVLYVFAVIFVAIRVVPADWWPSSHLQNVQDPIAAEVGNLNTAYRLLFGQGQGIILGSVAAFILGQIIDISLFQWIRKKTGDKYIWLRATGSTLISQLIDSFVVLFIAFYIGANWTLSLVLAVCTVNYIYKLSIAILTTPLIYMVHMAMDKYLGEPLASNMKIQALEGR